MTATTSVELSSLDLRYQDHRMKHPSVEARLLASISQRGIEQPLEGVLAGNAPVLLNGFKRFRCARTLGLAVVPFVSLGADEASAILGLLRASNHHALSILEQARFLDDLRALHRLSVAEIAATLARSKAWVSMRLGLVREMTPAVRAAVFAGGFPVYAYMYSLRPFMRMNGIPKGDIDAFVAAVAGKNLSVRDLDRLARGYFAGSPSFRAEVQAGHLATVLERFSGANAVSDACPPGERRLLDDLTIVQKYMLRVAASTRDAASASAAFRAQAHLLTDGIVCGLDAFSRSVRLLHDRSGNP
jgi:hypothetical protein